MARWGVPIQCHGLDFALGVMLFRLMVAKGEGLPHVGPYHDAEGTFYPPRDKIVEYANMRARIMVSLLFATLEPPTKLKTIGRAMTQIIAI